MNCNIKILPWQTAQKFAEPIRRTVFIEEQQIPETMEWDDMDDNATHAVAFDENDQMLGYARLLRSKQLGRMAVLSAHRGNGIGTQLLKALEELALQQDYEHIFLHAQIQALPFYESQGYQIQGAPFDEAGIPHLMMTKILGSSA